MQRVQFDGSSEIGAYIRMTNKYIIMGPSNDSQLRKNVEEYVNIPVVETTINSIKTVGSQIQGNKYGLLVPMTTSDHELITLRQLLPQDILIRRIDERMNALGNIILCNDDIALVHPEVEQETIEIIENVLNVPVHKVAIGDKPLVGSYGCMNSQGLLVDPEISGEDQKSLSELLKLQVTAGTVNMGNNVVGGGIVVNDWIGFCGTKTTNTEIEVMEKVFMLREGFELSQQNESVV